MAIPVLLEINPGNNSIGLPIGAEIVLSFDKGIDLATVQDYIVLYGADFDQTSGSESTLYIDKDTGDNPFLLRSPGFKGLVELQMRVLYYDLDTGLDLGSITIASEAEELAYSTGGIGHRIYLRPTCGSFAADTEYTLHILGDPSVQNTGISSRTIFDTVPDVGNVGTSGEICCGGSYTGSIDDTVVIEITTGGDIGTAKYEWYLQSAGSSSAKRDKLSNRRFRTLSDGVQIRFSGESFVAGDIYRCTLEAAQRLATNTKIVFSTNDGTYSLPPDSPSIPGTSEPPDTVIPPTPGSSTTLSNLQILEVLPGDGAFNVSLKTNQIVIVFNESLQASSITPDTVRIWKYPVLGYFNGQAEPKELNKKLTVSGSTLTIDI